MKLAGASLPILAAYAALATADANDYPTEARADYVFVCMKTNGETPDMLRRCSCSIDVIASLLAYDHYVAAQTVVSMNSGARSDRDHVPRKRGSQGDIGRSAPGAGRGRNSLLLTIVSEKRGLARPLLLRRR